MDGRLAPGTTTPGTFTINNALTLGSGSRLKFKLGTTSDKVVVAGDLTLDGTLDITNSGGLISGTHDLIEYSGTLNNLTLDIGTLPDGFLLTGIDTSEPGKVRVVLTDLYGIWQLEHFGCTTCPESARDFDADDDGFTNEQEFLAGTHPKDSLSALRITTVASANGVTTLSWTSVPGKTYRVYFNENLTGPWSDLLPGSLLTAAPGQTSLTYQDTTATSSRRFYRVKIAN